MPQLSGTTLYTNTIAGQTASTVAVPSGSNLYAPGHMLQIQTFTDTGNGTIYTTTSSTPQYNTVYSFSITPVSSSSKIVIWANVYVGCSISDQSGQSDGENRAILIRRGSTQITQSDTSSYYRFGGYWGSDVSKVSYNTNWYGHYDLECWPCMLVDTTTNTAGVAVTYNIVCEIFNTSSLPTTTFPYNCANSGGSACRGSSSYTVMELAV